MSSIDRSTYETWIHRNPSETFELMEMASSTSAIVPRLCRTITAFLNTSGGLIVVRIPSDTYGSNLEGEIYAAVELEIAPRPSVEVKVVSVVMDHYTSRSELLIVDVPVGFERPYSYKREILIRDGQSNQAPNRAKVLELIGESEDPDARWERQLLPSASEGDLEYEQIRDCMMRTEISGPMHSWRSYGDDPMPWSLLSYFNLGTRPLLRNSAIVTFGKMPTKFFPQCAIRAVAYDTGEAHAREIADEKTFSSNIFDNIKGCFSFLDRYVSISSRFPTIEDKSFQRGMEGSVPFLAVREAVLNAIVHRDFSKFDCNVIIKITPDEIEIWNPGAFPEGTDLNKLEDFRVSRPPNPDIANLLQRMGFIERLGSGVNRILKAFEAMSLPRPKWEEVGGGVRLTLKFGAASAKAIQRMARMLSSKLEAGEVLSSKRLASIGDLSLSDAKQVIDELCSRGFLIPAGEDRFQVMHR